MDEARNAESLFPAIPRRVGFGPESGAKLREAIDKAGPGFFFAAEHYVEGGYLHIRIHVYTADGVLVATVNESHPCPPWPPQYCGGG